jgi:hypothetical protein
MAWVVVAAIKASDLDMKKPATVSSIGRAQLITEPALAR